MAAEDLEDFIEALRRQPFWRAPDDCESITLQIRDHGKAVFITHPWPRRIMCEREFMALTIGRCLLEGTGKPSMKLCHSGLSGATIDITVDNGMGCYHELPIGGGRYWCGELIHSTYQPAPPEPADATA